MKQSVGDTVTHVPLPVPCSQFAALVGCPLLIQLNPSSRPSGEKSREGSDVGSDVSRLSHVPAPYFQQEKLSLPDIAVIKDISVRISFHKCA